ncbi:MAG: hypothetical protein ABL903_17640 [Methylococcales bacterium]
MKTLYTAVAAAALMAVLSGSAFAAGSEIEDSTINNSSQNQNARTTASGRNAKASTGSIKIEGSEVEDSKILNSSKNQGARTTASGRNSEADTGSVVIK